MYFIITKVRPYRQEVVRDNMERAFPDWNEEEVDLQMKRFNRYLSDLVVEGLKSLTISEDNLLRRFKAPPPKWMTEMAAQNQSVIITAGHYGNWEWFALACAQYMDHRAVGVYLPMRNKFFNRKFYKSRSRFGLELISTKEFKKHIEKSHEQPYAYLMLTDQSPTNAKRALWTTFLGRETAVQYGVEKYAKIYDLPVIYAEMTRMNRGFYETDYSLLTAHPGETDKGDITRMHVRALEKSIYRDPKYWLWTHRRWKHDSRPEENKLY